MGGTSSSVEPTQAKKKEDTRFEPFINSISDDTSEDIDKNKFINLFPSESTGFAGRLIEHITSNTNVAQRISCRQAFQRIASFTTASAQMTFYLDLCRSHDEALQEEDCHHLFRAAYHFHCQTSSMKFEDNLTADEQMLKVLVSTILLQGESSVQWLNQNSPEIFNGLHLWLMGLLTTSLPNIDSTLMTGHIPDNCILTGVLWWLLSASLPSEFSQPSKPPHGTSTEVLHQSRTFWAPLYRSNEHGLSINRFQHHVFAYRGPTVFLVTCSDGYSYALAVDVEWRDGTTPWGSQNSFIIQISPVYKILEEGEQMVLYNQKSRNIPKGIFIGRDRSKYSLKLTEGFQSAEHDGQNVDVLDVEVWGCGGTGAKAQQVEQKKREKQDTEKNAKVKLPGEWDENPDRLLLEWGGVRPSYGDQFKADFGPDARS